MRIVFFESNDEDQQTLTELLKTQAPQADLQFYPVALTPGNAELAQGADVVSVFIHSQVNEQTLDAMGSVRLVTTRSTGFDHIHVPHAAQKNITVMNVPAYGSRTVAEFTFSLILGLSRKSFAAYRQVKDNRNFSIENFKGFNLEGKTLGVIGTGRIGQNVAKIAKGFDMNVIAFDSFPNIEQANHIGFTYTDLKTLLATSDIVTLHVPYNKETHHLLNKENMSSLKKGALLINTARGEVVETEAILEALESGTLAGAGLDVLEGEKELLEEHAFVAGGHPGDEEHAAQLKLVLEDHMLIDLPQVAITPHIAFFTTEAKREIMQTTVANIMSFQEGKPQNVVKPQ